MSLRRTTFLLTLGAAVSVPMLSAVAAATFISEYGEGSSFNKYIEIHNPESAPVDLSQYRLWVAFNGTNWPDTQIALSGILATGGVFVVCHSSADQRIKVHADLITGNLKHSGNDAVGLAKTNGLSGEWELQDAVGRENNDPGEGHGWGVAGTNDATKDHVLRRKIGYWTGNTNWASSAGTNAASAEWIVHPKDTFDYVGYHGTPPEQPPFILLDPPGTSRIVLVNSLLSLDVIANDFNGDEITLVGSGLPVGASFPSVTNTPPITNTFAWTPESGGNTSVTFTATDNDGSCTAQVSITVSAVLPAPEKLWINEIHYDNDGSDTNEGVEVAGQAYMDLSDYRLYVYDDDGTFDGDLILAGSIDDESGGYGAVWFPRSGLENMAYGLALGHVQGGSTSILQFLSYEGFFAATEGPAKGFVSVDIGEKETGSTPIGFSLQLIGTGSVYSAFTWTGPVPASPGDLNSNQVISPPPTTLIIC